MHVCFPTTELYDSRHKTTKCVHETITLYKNLYFNLLAILISGRNPCRDVGAKRPNVPGRWGPTSQRPGTFCLNVPTSRAQRPNVPGRFAPTSREFRPNVPTSRDVLPQIPDVPGRFAPTSRRPGTFCPILPHFAPLFAPLGAKWGKMGQEF